MFARFNRFGVRLAMSCIGLVTCAPVAAEPVSLRGLAAQETRLESIGYRIATANSDKCASPQMITGLVVHSLSQYAREARPLVSGAFKVHLGIGVLGVVPDSVAARAGLKIDDEIIAANGQSLEDPYAFARRSVSYDEVDRFHQFMNHVLAAGPAQLVVRRDDRLINVALSGQRACGGLVKFAAGGNVNAWSDGTHVVLNRGIVDMARDDNQLAFVIAHEMAHNILGHSRPKDANRTTYLARLFYGPTPRNEESQADIAAVAMIHDAGFDPQGGIALLGTAQRRMWWAISFDRPSFASRAKAIAAAIASAPWSSTQTWAYAAAGPETGSAAFATN